MLSEEEKSQIRLYLGWPDQWRFRHTRLESVLDNVSPEAETIVRGYLESLATIDEAMRAANLAATGNVQRVDEISFHEPTTDGVFPGFKSGKEIGRMLASRISIVLGVPFNASAFGGRGYPGDWFMS